MLLNKLMEKSFSISSFRYADRVWMYHGINIYCGNGNLKNNIIYVCDETCLPDSKMVQNEAGLLIISRNSEDNDLPAYSGDYAIIKAESNLIELFSMAQNIFLDLTKNDANISILFKSLITGNGIKELIAISSKIFNSPIILTTTSYKVVAMSDNGIFIDDPVWNDAKLYGYCSSSSINLFESEGITKEVQNQDKAFLLDTGLANNIPRVLEKIKVNKKTCAYLGVFQITRKFTDEDLGLIDILCNIISVELEKTPAATKYTNILYESILLELLDHTITNQAILIERLHAAKWKLRSKFKCAIINFGESNETYHQGDYLLENLYRYLPDDKVIIYKQDILILINYDEQKEYHKSINKIESIIKNTGLIAGISQEFESILHLSVYYEYAVKVIQLSKVLGSKKLVYRYEDLTVYDMISEKSQEELGDMIDPFYKILNQYDLEKNSNYCDTLSVYIRNSCNITNAAKELFIHRNTMAHRLEKIQEITNVNLADGRQLMNYYLSECVLNWIKCAK